MKTLEMEIALIKHFNPRVNLVIPNVSWGMFRYELDLVVMTKQGCLYEVEIKVSRADLKKDLQKRHKHINDKIKYLYFAITRPLLDLIELIPKEAGVFVVEEGGKDYNSYCKLIREPKCKSEYKVTEQERYQLARLGTLRILGLKRKIINLQNKLKEK